MDISQITDNLLVGAHPAAEDAEEIRELGVRLIISMVGLHRPPEELGQTPFQLLWLQTFDTIFTPIALKKLTIGVEAALPVIQDAGAVFTFCMYGRHRSVAMAAAILIGMGYSAEQAMQLLESRREVADPRVWHIKRQITRFEKRWQETHHQIN